MQGPKKVGDVGRARHCWVEGGLQLRRVVEGRLTVWALSEDGQWLGLVAYDVHGADDGGLPHRVSHWLPARVLVPRDAAKVQYRRRPDDNPPSRPVDDPTIITARLERQSAVETWTKTTETCPVCGQTATVSWSGRTLPYQVVERLRLHATGFTCTRGCRPDPAQVHASFPDRLEN